MKNALLAIVVAIIMSWTLTSGLVTFNHVPKTAHIIQKQSYEYQYELGVLSVYLKSTMKAPDYYTDLIMLLNKHKNDRQIKIYLSGNGGSFRGLMGLVHTIQSLPAEVTMVVRGDVYSAHAMLALTGDKLKIINKNILFIYHVPAINVNGTNLKLSTYCDQQKGTDRGVSKKLKCKKHAKKLRASMFNAIEYMLVTKLFTTEQTILYYRGHDIILTGKHIKERIQK